MASLFQLTRLRSSHVGGQGHVISREGDEETEGDHPQTHEEERDQLHKATLPLPVSSGQDGSNCGRSKGRKGCEKTQNVGVFF